MDIKNSAITAKMVIHSLLALLENENVDISSVKFKVGSYSNEYESPEFELEKLVSLAIDGLVEIEEANAVPEGFVLVPKESLKVALSWMDEDIDPWQMGGDSFAELYAHKPILEKAMEAEEQSHGSQNP